MKTSIALFVSLFSLVLVLNIPAIAQENTNQEEPVQINNVEELQGPEDVEKEVLDEMDEEMDPGMLPNHPLYFFKDALRSIKAIFILNAEKKMDYYIEVADEKLAENNALLELEDYEFTEEDYQRYRNQLEVIKDRIEETGDEELRLKFEAKYRERLIEQEEELFKKFEQFPEKIQGKVLEDFDYEFKYVKEKLKEEYGEEYIYAFEEYIDELKKVRKEIDELRDEGENIPKREFEIENEEVENEIRNEQRNEERRTLEEIEDDETEEENEEEEENQAREREKEVEDENDEDSQ